MMRRYSDQNRRHGTGPYDTGRRRGNAQSEYRNHSRRYVRHARGQSMHMNDTIHPICYTKLKQMAEDDIITASDIILRLSNEHAGFSSRLKEEMDGGMIQMILEVIGKMCREEDPPECFFVILTDILESNFSQKLIEFLYSLLDKGQRSDSHASVHISNCLDLLKAWVEKIPTKSEHKTSMLTLNLRHVITKLNIGSEENIMQRLDEISSVLQELDQRYPTKSESGKENNEIHDQPPPNDFRRISVFPEANDINTSEEPFVRPNLVNAAFRSTDHYLDVQFRLLREDFVRPLREGIQSCFSQDGETRLNKQNQSDVKIYEDVTIRSPRPGHSGIQYCIHFNPERLQRVRWETSRRLIFGNLVCLSADKFKNHFLFASIAERDPKALREGYVVLEFVGNNAKVNDQLRENKRIHFDEETMTIIEEIIEDSDEENDVGIVGGENLDEFSGNGLLSEEDMKKTYYMVETVSYFEAYRHVLSGLQKIERIPMQRYIVECSREVMPPSYLRTMDDPIQYDFKSLLSTNGGNVDLLQNFESEQFEVLNTENWPSAEDLHLDISQTAALKSAITKEFSVIQGPPGTGKTHVGLLIMRLLLDNSKFRMPNQRFPLNVMENHSQILVVCYTNHALDQFLEGICSFQKTGIIRVGGRCKSEVLEKYKMKNARDNQYGCVSQFQRRTVGELKDARRRLQEDIDSLTDTVNSSSRVILSWEKLRKVIPRHLHHQFTGRNKEGNEGMLRWLLGGDYKRFLYDKPYIVTETVEAVAQPLMLQGYSYAHIVNAIITTERFENEFLIEWMRYNRPHQSENELALPAPDLVYTFLEIFFIPSRFQPLLEYGFHPIEIKCALFVTGSRNVENIARWLTEQTTVQEDMSSNEKLFSKKKTTTQPIDTFEIQDDDIAFIENDRRIDSESDEDSNVNSNESVSEPPVKKRRKKQRGKMKHSSVWQLPTEEKKQQNDRIAGVDAMQEAEAEDIDNIHHLDQKDRWRLYRHWIQKLKTDLQTGWSKYNRITKSLNQAKLEIDYAILRRASVIGMTTTGAAKYRDIVYRLPAKVVVVEEAAEVLEAHIVTSMPRATEHLILIGDHQQLKPSPTVYELARKFNLDISLFERMIKNDIPFSRLALQHRMRPRIADLVRPHIYKDLQDDESVMKYEDVTGVQKNVYFMSHQFPEDGVEDGKSKVNRHEAKYLIAFCQYLLQQGYSTDQITILTAYVGQLHVINRMMSQSMRKVRVAAIDNFQGEENDIILLSLVRSNDEGKIGFLNIENRVCVALSRAKKGLFCIGNLTLLKDKSNLWKNILSDLERDGLVGDGLPLQCKNHPETFVLAKTVKDFEKVPEGGCNHKCSSRLPCGHACTRYCHPDDEEHVRFRCRKPCEKTCENGHKCQLKCFEECCCPVVMEKTLPSCGHKQNMACHINSKDFVCKAPCSSALPCGHKCPEICGKSCPTKCYAKMKVQPNCGHPPVTVSCHRSNKLRASDCKERCKTILKCGHPCPGSCDKCLQGRLHKRCQQKCDRILFCGHLCREKCSAKCPPCARKCETVCHHSKCPKKCYQPCDLCKEKCNITRRWTHKKNKIWRSRKCSKLCSEPCDVEPSNTPCKMKLKCGHQCIGLIDEPCPKLCRICNKDEVTEIFFGNEAEDNARFVELECGHVFTYEDLDKWMEMESDGDGDAMNIQLKECPRCKTIIRKSKRYSHIINKQLRLINEVKKKIIGDSDEILQTRGKLEKLLEDNTLSSLYRGLLQNSLMKARTLSDLKAIEIQYRNLFNLRKLMATLLSNVVSKDEIIAIREDLKTNIQYLSDWLFEPRSYFSDQELVDLEGEYERLKECLVLIQIKNALSNTNLDEHPELCQSIEEAEETLFKKKTRYDQCQDQVEKLMENIKLKAPFALTGLGITNEEKEMIVKAMSFKKGHWYKCKNGHIYCIGECGGATQIGKCPECGETIGGQSHRLADDNAVASEMDGATRPAYDPENLFIPPEVFN